MCLNTKLDENITQILRIIQLFHSVLPNVTKEQKTYDAGNLE